MHGSQDRARAVSAHGWRYRQVSDSLDYCRYCGDAAEEWDHCPNIGWVDRVGASTFIKRHIRFLLVPSCEECNHFLTHEQGATIRQRKDTVIRKLQSKYATYLSIPKWSAQELPELEGNLSDYVSASVYEKARIQSRINYAKRGNGGFGEEDNWQLQELRSPLLDSSQMATILFKRLPIGMAPHEDREGPTCVRCEQRLVLRDRQDCGSSCAWIP